ncbi:G-protein coupled receptor Mth2-like [Sitodiplosis mosellana]|uniref:G-protein coupled receptor Mth2-like n=1 Tax=Sitodiplosis mosellana TaxID=263140 RepID=UPI0024450401|nr:G-protein coupled receptor Mth2-like [Sitodiplosis mosellana]
MNWFSVCLLSLAISLTSSNKSGEDLINRELRCDFVDSVNITGGIEHQNGKIIFDGIEYSEDQYAAIDYISEDGFNRISVRGCTCNIRPCVRLCCPHGSFVESMEFGQEVECREDETAKNLLTEVLDENGRTNITNLDQHFGYVNRICDFHYYAKNFVITHTGHVLVDNELFNHREYCIRVTPGRTKAVNIQVMLCMKGGPDVPSTRHSILPYALLTSIPFLIATFLIYIFIPELRNLHGKCFLSYLLCLIMVDTSLSLAELVDPQQMEWPIRKAYGILTYFAFFSSFLWLNVISFDLWSSFRSIKNFRAFSERKQSILYNVYAWTLSLLITIMANVLDSIESLPDYLRPGTGVDTLFLKENSSKKITFYYIPLSIILAVNVVFFILAARRIHKIQHDERRKSAKGSSQRQNQLIKMKNR